MAEWLELHPQNPQARWIRRAADSVLAGGVVVYPTDSCYALGCAIGERDAAQRLRRIRGFDRHHLFTLMCSDLSEIATYAKVDNRCYRLLKSATPGPFTFVLQATRELPRRILQERRKTIGIRIPDHRGTQALLQALGKPLLSCTFQWPGEPLPVNSPRDCARQLDGLVDVVLDGGPCGLEPTTVVDLSGGAPELLRHGAGDPAILGLDGA